MSGTFYRVFAWLIVIIYLALSGAALVDRHPKQAVIAFIFACSNAAIFLWR